jgi:hypothetical protein
MFRAENWEMLTLTNNDEAIMLRPPSFSYFDHNEFAVWEKQK